MFTKKPSQAGQPSLDLSTLESYSPKWSPHLRLAACIAVKYAVARHVERASALFPAVPDSQKADPSTTGASAPTAKEISQEWQDYGEKFLMATCQHLGVQMETLPPAPIGLEDVLNAAQGRIIEPSPSSTPLPSHFEPQYESGSDHMRRFPNLDLPIKGVDDSQAPLTSSSSPPNESSQAAQARRKELEDTFADLDLESRSVSSLSDDLEKFSYDDDAKELPEYFRNDRVCAFEDADTDQDQEKERQKRAADAAVAQQGREAAVAAPKRIQGVIDAEAGQEIEIAHELLLVALGLGQFRAQDGSTTLFEQDMLFGETNLDLPRQQQQQDSAPQLSSSEKPELPPRPHKPTQSDKAPTPQGQEASSAPTGSDFSTDAYNTMTGAGKFVAGASKTAFSSLKTGTVTGWGKLSSASKELVGADSNKNSQEGGSVSSKFGKKKLKKPVKPNEVCHYDARARSIIFVAVTAMGIAGKQVWLAEKVMAQTIYFIMSEGNKASASQGGDGKGLIDRLPLGASLDPSTGNVTQAQAATRLRSEYMNQHTDSVVEREREKVSWGKWAAMGGGFIAGGLVIGLTGGLAAPLIAPALVGLTGASFLATSGGIIMLGTLFGLGGGGLAGYKVERRLRGVSSFSFAELQTEARRAGVAIPSLHATICCSGLILEEGEQVKPWEAVFEHFAKDGRDAFAIECEATMMKEAGVGLRSYMIDQLIRTGGTKAAEEVIKKTALAGIAAITLPLTVFNAASATLDGVFVRAKTKSYKAGLILAETLRNEVQGHRPVVLIGISLGAATILTALEELAKMEDGESQHLVDSVILISAPITPSSSSLRRMRGVVQRRFVNAFSTNDMVCRIAAWLGSGSSVNLQDIRNGDLPKVAGSKAINNVPGLENINIDDIITSHFQVNDPVKLGQILNRCGVFDD